MSYMPELPPEQEEWFNQFLADAEKDPRLKRMLKNQPSLAITPEQVAEFCGEFEEEKKSGDSDGKQ